MQELEEIEIEMNNNKYIILKEKSNYYDAANPCIKHVENPKIKEQIDALKSDYKKLKGEISYKLKTYNNFINKNIYQMISLKDKFIKRINTFEAFILSRNFKILTSIVPNMEMTYDFATHLNLLNEPADSDFEKGIKVSHLKECIDTDKINEFRYFNEIVSLKDSIQSVFNSNYKMNAIESKELNALNDKISEFLSSNFDKFSENSKDYYYIKPTSAFQSIHFMISEKMYVQLAFIISSTTLELTIFIALLFKLFKLAFGL